MSDEPARLAGGADAGSRSRCSCAQLCGLKSGCVVESHVLCLGVSAPGGPSRAVCSCIHWNHAFFNMSHTFGKSAPTKKTLEITARVPASNDDFMLA